MKKYITTLILLSVFLYLIPTKSNAQLSTVGKEFWVGFLENFRVNNAPDVGIIIITAEETSSGVIQYGNQTINFSLNPDQQFIHRITTFDALHRETGIIENKGVYIASSGNISVHAFNERFRSADGTVVLPTNALGKDYLVTSHFEVSPIPPTQASNLNANNESIFLIVAIENDTQIEITPSATTINGNNANIPFIITLNRGQSYQLKARMDLTGSRVRVIGSQADDCKNIAVFGGNKWTSVGECGSANDHLFQQMYPIGTWGTEYIHIPLAGRSSGELVKILASENNTEIRLNGTLTATLNAGEFRIFNFRFDEVVSIRTSLPSAVTVFSKSQQCNDINKPFYMNGDPFMITYSPNNQRLNSLVFNAIQLPSITQHFVTIIVLTDTENETRLDGQALNNQFSSIPGTDFSYARLGIAQGVHTLSNPDGFIAYVYGFGEIESYGYSAGARLENLNFEIEPKYDFDVSGQRVACLNQEALWEVFPENELFTYFLWDFGDGSPTKEGKAVKHTYSTAGTFEVVLIAALSPTSCDDQQTIRFDVRVEQIIGQIIGPASVCPEVDEITYRYEGDEFLKIIFAVEGGEITSSNESEGTVTIRWGESNPAAKILAIPYTKQGCPMSQIEFAVVINQVIDSTLPKGETRICFENSRIDLYSIENPVSERIYTWFVTGGTFQGTNQGPEVSVAWTNQGGIGEIWYTEVSTLDDLCAGESPKLRVEINPLFEASVGPLKMVSCFAGNDGSIQINVSGGTAPYTYRWSHDGTLDQPIANKLPVGNYSVRVADAFGCEVSIIAIEIQEPDLLEIDSIETVDISCFGKDDGIATINVLGGTAPYSIDYPFASIQANQVTLTNLEGRGYSLEITDALGCKVPVLFQIGSPLPLSVDVRIQKPACPGESNGILLAEPSGDFPPFVFNWAYDNSSSAQLSNIPVGTYSVSVRNQNGCVSVGTASMIEEKPMVRMPTGFNPVDGLFQGVSNCSLVFELKIINRWGQLVYSGNTGWNGKIDDETAPLGTYSYLMTYRYVLDGQNFQEDKRGVFTLVR